MSTIFIKVTPSFAFLALFYENYTMLSRLSLSSNLVGFDTGSELCLLSSSVFLRFFRSRYRFFLFLQHKLDVARRRHVRVDATVRSVRSSSLRDGLIDLDVRDVEIVNVQPLNLGIRFRVLEQVDQDLRALLRPSALAVRGSFVFGLRGSPDAAAESAKDDASFHFHHRCQESYFNNNLLII